MELPASFLRKQESRSHILWILDQSRNDILYSDYGDTTLELSEQYVRYLLAKGEIKGKRLGRDWVVLSLDYKRGRRPKRTKGGK